MRAKLGQRLAAIGKLTDVNDTGQTAGPGPKADHGRRDGLWIAAAVIAFLSIAWFFKPVGDPRLVPAQILTTEPEITAELDDGTRVTVKPSQQLHPISGQQVILFRHYGKLGGEVEYAIHSMD